MPARLHVHVPKLQEFALYAACDDITKHGMPGLTKPIPYPLYLRAISTFNDKHSNVTTIKNIYDITLTGKEFDGLGWSLPLSSLISALDHVVDITSVDKSVIQGLMKISDDDPDAVIEFIHRFAARCMSSTKHELLVTLMSAGLKSIPCKSIRQVLLHYGARIELSDDTRQYLYYACSLGLKEMLEEAIVAHRSAGKTIHEGCMRPSIESGDVDTIKMVAEALGGDARKRNRSTNFSLNCRDFDIQLCELLLSLGIIERGSIYLLDNVRSVAVMQWLIEHGMVSTGLERSWRGMTSFLDDAHVAHHAALRGGPYLDVLYYLVEQVQIPPSDSLWSVMLGIGRGRAWCQVDLGVFDYVIQHGADVNAIQANSNKTDSELRCPYLLRYWLDKGLTMNEYDTARFLENSCIKNGSLEWLKIAMSALKIDVREWLLKQPHGTLILEACSRTSRVADRYELVQYLLDHGATVDVHGASYIMSPIHEACKLGDIEIVSLLINHGADVNEVASNYRMSARETPLFIACYCDNRALVELLLSHGADASFKSGHQTCNSVTTNSEIKNLLKQSKPKTKKPRAKKH